MGKAGFKAACDAMFAGDGGGDDDNDDVDDDDDGDGDGELGALVYRSVHACFEWLPFACVVEDRFGVYGLGSGFEVWNSDAGVVVYAPFAQLPSSPLPHAACCACTVE